ncbi:MAG: glycine cleavage system protein T [Thiotrichales bacterium]|nr:glycine cleavage system protein T [Thiotrichales bacterium]
MKEHAQAVVIGGGVVGASVLYHLTREGWKDVVLVERDELTSGSTWHAAGGMHTLNGDPNVAKLQEYTISLYKEIEEISGQSTGFHLTEGIMLAGSKERMDWLRAAHARGRYLGMRTELISAKEAADIFPLMDPQHFVGAMYDENEGHVDPNGVTNAYAKAARVQGAEIYRHTRVTDLVQRQDGSWDVITEKGNIHAQHVVNAGGLWGREVGRMVGIELPCLAMAHQYLITEDMPEVIENDGEMLHCIDFEGEIYMRQERQGMLVGTYEAEGAPWHEHEAPWDFSHELLPPDIDRIAERLETGFKHFPALERAGIKQLINGPFTFAPDGNPLIGPIRGRKNFWVACAVMAGFSQGGGVGLALANWMIHGDPGFDVWAMDVARYGDWATRGYANAKVRENYSRRFQIVFPNEELEAARNLRKTPVYERLKAKNAVFGAAAGLEHALWYAPEGTEPKEQITFRRSNAFEHVKEECRAVREAVGLIEISTFAKYEVTGPDAEVWLSHLLANHMPKVGKMVLAPMLNPEGKLIGDFTVAKMDNERFYIFGGGVAETYHMRWFEEHLPESGVNIRALGLELVGFSIAGPKSRELLSRLTHLDVSNQAFRFMSIREFDLGMIPALIGRVTFTGDLGYEIWVKAEYQNMLYDLLLENGEDLGLRHFGGRALNALRLEKGFGSWATEFRPIYGPFEADMGRFIDLSKNDFIGRDAALKEKEDGPARFRVTLVIDDDGVDVMGNEPVWHNDEVVGWITSGGYAHFVEKSLAIGYIPAELAVEGTSGFEVEVLGVRRPAELSLEPPLDPKALRMRG